MSDIDYSDSLHIFNVFVQDKSGSNIAMPEESEKTSSTGSSKTDISAGNVNIVIECAMNGNVERFVRCFKDENDPFHNSVASLVNLRSEHDNKSPLDWAALVGNIAMVKELIKRGANVNAVSEKGKLNTAVHNPLGNLNSGRRP